jgi:hypothetical protein
LAYVIVSQQIKGIGYEARLFARCLFIHSSAFSSCCGIIASCDAKHRRTRGIRRSLRQVQVAVRQDGGATAE